MILTSSQYNPNLPTQHKKFKLCEIFKTLTSHICIRILSHIPVKNYEDACRILYCNKQSVPITVVK
jgi:hypothetical protein